MLPPEDLDRRLADLPGVHRGVAGSLTLAVRAPAFADAVRLLARIADEAEQMDHHPDVDLRWRTLYLTLATHSAGGVTELDLELGRRIVAAAGDLGAEILPPPERLEIALDCADAAAVRPFWAAGLGYVERTTADGQVELHDPAGRGPALWFQHMDPPRAGRGRFHLDVYVPAQAADERVAACLSAGGVLVSREHAPSWWVLADAEGNELCVCTRGREPAPGAR